MQPPHPEPAPGTPAQAAGRCAPVVQGIGSGWLQLLLILTCSLFLFGEPACQAGWAMDDQETIGENPLVRGDRPAWQAFGQDYWHHRGDAGLYRPLVTLSMRWNYQILGAGPSGFHSVNVLLHLAVVAWAAFVCALLRPAQRLPLWALAIFALHPIQSEAVVWIAGRSSSLCALLGLMPLGLYLAGRRSARDLVWVWAFLGCLLPVLVKEDGLAFAAVWWFLPLGLQWKRRVALFAGLLLALGLRFVALDGLGVQSSHGALAGLSFIERVPLGLGILGKGFTCLVWPSLALQEVNGSGMGWQWLGAGILAMVLFRLVHLRSATSNVPAAGTGARAWFFALCLALLPWLQWIPAPELFGPRFLYLPLLCAIFIVPVGLRTRTRSHLVSFAGLLILTTLLRSPVRSQSAGFESPIAYWRSRTLHRPEDSRAWNGLGQALLKAGSTTPESLERVRAHLQHSIGLDPRYSRPHVGLAALARLQNKPEIELKALQRALSLAPDNPVAWANLGSLHLRQMDSANALIAYRNATALQPGRAAFWRGLARAHSGLEQAKEASQAIRKAYALNPRDELTLKWLERLSH